MKPASGSAQKDFKGLFVLFAVFFGFVGCGPSIPAGYYDTVAHTNVTGGSGVTMSYTDNGNGTVTVIPSNSFIGLMWQQRDDGVKRNWADAGTYCAGLTLGGFSDWRLPTKDELGGLTDASWNSSGVVINGLYFLNTKPDSYWSSTPWSEDYTEAWQVHFRAGWNIHWAKTSADYVRCVRP